MLVLFLATDWLNTKSAKVYNFFNPLCKMSTVNIYMYFVVRISYRFKGMP